MRHETCLICLFGTTDDPELITLTAATESIAGDVTHHHHTIECGQCGTWWFGNVVIGGLGIPVDARRDTVLCDCDENLPQYSRCIIQVPRPESECQCTQADVDKHKLTVRLKAP